MPIDGTRVSRPQPGSTDPGRAPVADDRWEDDAPPPAEPTPSPEARLGARLLEVEDLTIGFGPPKPGATPVVDRAN